MRGHDQRYARRLGPLAGAILLILTPAYAQAASSVTRRSLADTLGRLAFSAERNGNTDIYAVNTDGSGLQRLTGDPADEFDPTWSPDGTRIAFRSRGTDQGVGDQIYSMNADGSDRINLTR